MRKWFLGNLNTVAIQPFLAPDDGAAQGGAGGGDGDGTDSSTGSGSQKTFTQEEVNALIEQSQKRWRKGLQKDNETKAKQLEELQKSLQETKEEMELLKTGVKKDDTPKDLEGQFELFKRRTERETISLKEQLEQEKKAREKAEEEALRTKRDTAIFEALATAKCRSDAHRAAFRYVVDDVTWEPEEGAFFYHTQDDKMVKLKDGIQEYLPDFMKESQVQGGGSGSRTGTPRRNQKLLELEAMQKELERKEKEVRRNPQDYEAVNQWQRQKREVQKLKQELDSLK